MEKNTNNILRFNVADVLRILWKNAWIIIATGIFIALIGLNYCVFYVTPTYESTMKIYVLNKGNTDNLTSSDMTVSSSLTKDYAEMIVSHNVIDRVISKLKIDMTYEQFLAKISVKSGSSSDSRILSITVTDTDPYVAREIVTLVCDIATQHIEKVMAMNVVNVVDTAIIPDKKASPDMKKYGGVGFLGGLIIATFIVLLVYLSNDTIRDQSDVEKYLGLSVLGKIPLSSKKNNKNRKKK